MKRENRSSEHPGLTEDLKGAYPISPMQVIKDSFYWLIAFVALRAVTVMAPAPRQMLDQEGGLAINPHDLLLSLSVGCAMVVLAKVAHSVLEYWKLSYAVHGDTLIVSRGVVSDKKDITFIPRIADVYVGRNGLDYVMGLHFIGIVVPGQKDIILSGFSTKVAAAFQQHLIDLVQSLTPGAAAPQRLQVESEPEREERDSGGYAARQDDGSGQQTAESRPH
jgi:membrane protein YdbS with pleckstrin-like domain